MPSTSAQTMPPSIGAERRLRPPAAMLAGLLVLAAPLAYGFGGDAVIAAAFAVILVALATVDLEERRIPNRIVLPAAAAALAAQALLHSDRIVEISIAGVGAAAFFLVPALIAPGSVGMGDVKLALLMGFVLGSAVVAALLVASFGAALLSGYLIVTRGRSARKQTIPYGPFLAGGALLVMLGAAPPL